MQGLMVRTEAGNLDKICLTVVLFIKHIFIGYAVCCSRSEMTGSVKECPEGPQKPLSLSRTLKMVDFVHSK